jgi:transaldolase / glucose-6-phosphate isomerase
LPTIRDYIAQGQSIWYDYLRRSFITSGDMQALIDQGLRGVTSNPSIFEAAILGSVDYDDELKRLVDQKKPAEEISDRLMLDDVARAADLLRPVYDSLDGSDGYVSVEVSPKLAGDAEKMVEQARRFFYKLDRPNVMMTIPATAAGIRAARTLIGEGINVSVTLIFSVAQYEAATEAYLEGLEVFAARGGDLRKVASVASFFLSRVNTAVDRELEKVGEKTLQGKIATANAKLAYEKFKEIFSDPSWAHLEARGARIQRLVWASTSTKNPTYPDTMYIDNLIGPDTVNTVTPTTLRSALDHGHVAANTVEIGLDEAMADLERLSRIGINLDAIAGRLQDEGISTSSKSIDALLSNVAHRREKVLSESHHESAALGPYQAVVDASLRSLGAKKIIHRIWAHDYSVWKPEPTEISNRLDWLHSPEMMLEHLPRFNELIQEVRSAGYTHIVLLGMGGSSLAPAVFAKVFGKKDEYPELTVLDNTDPDTVLAAYKRLNMEKTLFIVSSKSGGTVETLSLMKYFYARAVESVGNEKAGEHFVVITDPGSELASIADTSAFRTKILNDPNIGGRYSVLSYDGLVPAALIGVDLAELLGQAMNATSACEPSVQPKDNPGAWLGVVLGELAKIGRDKVTFVISPQIESFGNWIEQLIAESTGKEGKGILPVVGEPLGPPEAYGDDRLFVSLRLDGEEDALAETRLSALRAAGHPVVHLRMHGVYELGRQFFLWEMAIAVAGYIIGVNPFDQPNVESAKVLARKMVADYKVQHKLPSLTPALTMGEIAVYGDVAGSSPDTMLTNFLAEAKPGAYIAIQAYVQPTDLTDRSLLELRKWLMERFKLATTVGYGPRFLHSTGQLHKGDAGRGFFVQITSGDKGDLPVPDELGASKSSVSFGVLKEAEALGDRQALLSAGRKIISFHIEGNVPAALDRLTGELRGLAVLSH